MIHTLRPCRGTLCALLLAGLVGCVSSLHEQPPAQYSIAGVWELNRGLSSDSDRVLGTLQPKPRSRLGGAGHGPAAEPPGPQEINDPTTDLPPADPSAGVHGPRRPLFGDPNAYRAPIDIQANALLGGQWLKIQQTDTEMDIASDVTTRSFTPGQHSVVSVTSGVADQESGWSGKDYKISLKPQIGPTVDETYTLSADARQLRVTINVGAEGRNQAITVVRVYDRSTRDPASLRQTLQQTLPPAD
jgi:hypothetical protein